MRIRSATLGKDLVNEWLQHANLGHHLGEIYVTLTVENLTLLNLQNITLFWTIHASMKNHRELKEIRNETDSLLAQAEYINNLLDGIIKIWNENGLLVEVSYFKAGKRHGSYTSWWDNGVKKEEGFYSNGIKVGKYIWYSEEGYVVAEHDY